MNIRRFDKQKDAEAVWEILHLVVKAGDTLVFAPDSTKEKMLTYWSADDKYAYVCEIDNQIVGTFYIKQNQPDLGAHIANAGYLVHPNQRGKGYCRSYV